MVIIGPVLQILAELGWVLLGFGVVSAGVAFYFRAKKAKEAAGALEGFVRQIDGRAEFIVVDTETSGLYPSEGARVVQIAMIGLDRHLSEIARFSTVINPHGSVGKSDLHGVTRTRAFFAPDFFQVAAKLHEAFNNRVLIAHNAEFDEKFVRMEFERANFTMPSARLVDTLALARKHVKGSLNYKLMTLVADLGVDLRNSPIGGAHDALYDAWCCAEVFKQICSRASIDPESFIRRE